MALSGIAATLGLFIVFLLGSLTAWRNVALFCFTIPVATMIAICFVSLQLFSTSELRIFNENQSKK